MKYSIISVLGRPLGHISPLNTIYYLIITIYKDV